MKSDGISFLLLFLFYFSIWNDDLKLRIPGLYFLFNYLYLIIYSLSWKEPDFCLDEISSLFLLTPTLTFWYALILYKVIVMMLGLMLTKQSFLASQGLERHNTSIKKGIVPKNDYPCKDEYEAWIFCEIHLQHIGTWYQIK